MNRTGIRPGFRFCRGLSEAADGYRRVLPFRRSVAVIGIVAGMDLAFLLPAIFTFRQAAAEWGGFSDLFDLVAAVFLSAWLLGWSIAPLLLTTVLAMTLVGREVVRIRDQKLELFFGLPIFGIAASYRLDGLRNLRLAEPEPKSGKSWRGRYLEFDYGAQTVALGSDMGPADLAELTEAARAETGRSPRTGEATREELEGQWKPDAVMELLQARPSEAEAPNAPHRTISLASPSALALILANLVPLYGSVFLGWRLGDVMVLYWAESAVIGFFNVCKMSVISRWMAVPAGVFFLSHFGAFMAVHFLFIYTLFIEGPGSVSGGDLGEVAALFADLWPALAALFASHALSFFRNFIGRREYRGRSLKQQMSEPYRRIIFMHLVLIFGGGITLVLGQPTPVLLVVIVLKVWMDLRAHRNEHET